MKYIFLVLLAIGLPNFKVFGASESLPILKSEIIAKQQSDSRTRMIVLGLMNLYRAENPRTSETDKKEILETLQDIFKNQNNEIKKFILQMSPQLKQDSQLFYNLAKSEESPEVLIETIQLGRFLNINYAAENNLPALILDTLCKLPIAKLEPKKRRLSKSVGIISTNSAAVSADDILKGYIRKLLALAVLEGAAGQVVIERAKNSQWPLLKEEASQIVITSQP